MEAARIIITHTPPYVWVLLVLLIILGVRRLKPRRTHLALAALAPVSFFIWSIIAAGLSIHGGNEGTAVIAWAVPFMLGALSGPLRTVPRPAHVNGWIFYYEATALPLGLYVLVWGTRYGLGIWAGFQPAMAGSLELAGLAVSALTAGRTFADFLPPLSTGLRIRRARITTT